MDVRAALAAAVFLATFVLLATGRLGRMQLLRGPVALVGGILTAGLLWIPPSAIDLEVIALIVGLMVLASLAEATGLFAGLRRRLLHRSAPVALWSCLLLVAATSAALLNDAAVVVLVPFLLPVVLALGINPVAAVVLMAVAANVGSLLTPFGNPQNAVLAEAAGLGVADFLRVQGPLVAMGCGLLAAASWVATRRLGAPSAAPPHAVATGRHLLLAPAAVLAAGIAVIPDQLGWVALASAAVGWLACGSQAGLDANQAVRRGVDLNVVALFAGMYLLTAGLPHWMPTAVTPNQLEGPWVATGAVTLLSNTVGNVPAMLAFLRLDLAWTVAHAPFLVAVSTLGGALLLTGSAASLLAADQARRSGIEVRFAPFARWAVPTVLPLLAIAVAWTWRVSPAP